MSENGKAETQVPDDITSTGPMRVLFLCTHVVGNASACLALGRIRVQCTR